MDVFGVYGHGCVFHSTCYKIPHGNLGVFFPLIFYAEFFFKKRNHLPSSAKNCFGIRGIFGFYIITQFKTASDGITLHGKVSHHKSRQIRGVRKALYPTVGTGAVGIDARFDQLTVGESFETIFHRKPKILRHFFVGTVHRRHPTRIVFSFSLRPNLLRFAFFQSIGVDKIQPLIAFGASYSGREFVGFGYVINQDVQRVKTAISATQFYGKKTFIVGVFERVSNVLIDILLGKRIQSSKGIQLNYAFDIEAFGVEFQGILGVKIRFERNGGASQRVLAKPIKTQLQLSM